VAPGANRTALPKSFDHDDATLFAPTLRKLDAGDNAQLTVDELWQQVLEIQAALKRATFYKIIGPLGFALRRVVFKVPDSWLRDRPPEVESVK
jgi:hypothetical protein